VASSPNVLIDRPRCRCRGRARAHYLRASAASSPGLRLMCHWPAGLAQAPGSRRKKSDGPNLGLGPKLHAVRGDVASLLVWRSLRCGPRASMKRAATSLRLATSCWNFGATMSAPETRTPPRWRLCCAFTYSTSGRRLGQLASKARADAFASTTTKRSSGVHARRSGTVSGRRRRKRSTRSSRGGAFGDNAE
jgi:hypothetical protein